MRASLVARSVIQYTFYALFSLVPIVWFPSSSELFEFNKMLLVYLAAGIILTVWLLSAVEEKKFTLKRTPIDIPIFLFLLANILSTIFSIDTHTSIFGYYSRFNGGLLSTFSYLILFYALVTFFDKESLKTLLRVLLASSGIVTIYAILQHPTPFFRNTDGGFRGIDAGYWQQDSESRVFSTLGHPNWLAALLAMLTPFAFYFLAKSKKLLEKWAYSLLLIGYFLAFTFTYSRGGTLGFLATILVLAAGYGYVFRDNLFKKRNRPTNLQFFRPNQLGFYIILVIIGWLATVLIFGNAFTSRGIDFASITAEGETQLAAAGAETGKIRLIVWKGAVDIFKHYPLLGSGVETFAHGYHLFRPPEHNLTGEWDFIYNKAHNEFVNYLATTGLVGIGTYIFFIITFLYVSLTIMRLEKDIWHKLFVISALAGYIGYLVQNFFSFSVVPIALLFYLTPAFVFIFINKLKEVSVNLNFLNSFSVLLAKSVIFLFGIASIGFVTASWAADYYYATGISSSNLQKSYQDLKFASSLRPDEPLYKAELGATTVAIATSLPKPEKSKKIQEGFDYLNEATDSSPNNINILRTRLQAIYGLSAFDQGYIRQSVETAERIAALAPTEAQIQYNLATMYIAAKDYKKAQEQLGRVVDLRFTYKEAWGLLLRVDRELKDDGSLGRHTQKVKEVFSQEDATEILKY